VPVILTLRRYALICWVLMTTPSFAQFPIPRNADCVDLNAANVYPTQYPKQINPIQYGYQEPGPFFLKNGHEWEKWHPNVYRQELASLQVQPLPADLVEAYLNGSAGVYATIKMWKSEGQEKQPFAIFGSVSFFHCTVVSYDALQVIGIGGTVMRFMHIGVGDEYPTADGRIQPIRRNEAMLWVGKEAAPDPPFAFPARYLLLKRIQSTPCKLDKESRPALIEGANQTCLLHRASAPEFDTSRHFR
jgi:hypothetical protein